MKRRSRETYAAALLAILGVHELGHYVVARWHGVDVTLPYFIPVPMGLGTFGAFIQIKSLIRSRRAVFDIGIAGPLAGLFVALPVLYFGLRATSEVAADSTMGVNTGSSILLALLYQLAQGGELGSTTIRLSPLGLTVWPGLLTWALLIALIAGFSHMPALDDVTPPDAKRFALGALTLLVLVLIVAPLPAAARGMMLDCPYM